MTNIELKEEYGNLRDMLTDIFRKIYGEYCVRYIETCGDTVTIVLNRDLSGDVICSAYAMSVADKHEL